MSYRLQFEIEDLPETINTMLALPLRKRMRRKKYWRRYVWAMTATHRPPAPLLRAALTLTRFSTTRPDNDNLASSFKYIIDGLVIGKVLANDKDENIGFPKYLWEKAPPRKGKIRVVVEEVS